MITEKITEISAMLASGHPCKDPEEVKEEFIKILKTVLPFISRRALEIRHKKEASVEEIWEAIKNHGEKDFQPAIKCAERPNVIYVTSKFMNNEEVGTKITEAALTISEEGGWE